MNCSHASAQIHAGQGIYHQPLSHATAAGRYALELFHHDSLVLAEDLEIRAAPPTLRLSSVAGSGLGNSRLAYGGCEYADFSGDRLLAAGVDYSLHLQLRDAFNNSYDAGVVAWDDRFAAHVAASVHVRGADVDVAFRPRLGGRDLPFRLLIDGSPLFDSNVSIVPGPASYITAAASREKGTAGDSVFIDLQTFDAEGNRQECCCQSADVGVLFLHLQTSVVSIAALNNRTYVTDSESIIATLPTVPGDYAINIQSGNLQCIAAGNFSVVAAAVDPRSSYLEARSTGSTGSTGSIELRLVMLDRFNNVVPSLAAITNITVIPPASVNVSVGVSDVLVIVYNFTRPGAHLVYVFLDFQPISTFPFLVNASYGSVATRSASRLLLVGLGVGLASFSGLFVAAGWRRFCRGKT